MPLAGRRAPTHRRRRARRGRRPGSRPRDSPAFVSARRRRNCTGDHRRPRASCHVPLALPHRARRWRAGLDPGLRRRVEGQLASTWSPPTGPRRPQGAACSDGGPARRRRGGTWEREPRVRIFGSDPVRATTTTTPTLRHRGDRRGRLVPDLRRGSPRRRRPAAGSVGLIKQFIVISGDVEVPARARSPTGCASHLLVEQVEVFGVPDGGMSPRLVAGSWSEIRPRRRAPRLDQRMEHPRSWAPREFRWVDEPPAPAQRQGGPTVGPGRACDGRTCTSSPSRCGRGFAG